MVNLRVASWLARYGWWMIPLAVVVVFMISQLKAQLPPGVDPLPTPLEANEKTEIWSGDGELRYLDQQLKEKSAMLVARIEELRKIHKADALRKDGPFCELNPKLEWDCARRAADAKKEKK